MGQHAGLGMLESAMRIDSDRSRSIIHRFAVAGCYRNHSFGRSNNSWRFTHYFGEHGSAKQLAMRFVIALRRDRAG
jgi:hypothetical protein